MGASTGKGYASAYSTPALALAAGGWRRCLCRSAMEPILTNPPQLSAAIEAWELACASGWTEPAPEAVQLPLPAPTEPDPTLIGSGWDSWSGNHWLENPQIDELFDYTRAD